MTIASPRPTMKFPINSPLPPLHVRAVRDRISGQLYHRDEFDCFTRTGDEQVFDWVSLNHTDVHGNGEGPRWVGVELEEVIEFTRPEVLFDDVVLHLKSIEGDLTAMLNLELLTAPLPIIAMLSEAQRVVRQSARMLGVKLGE